VTGMESKKQNEKMLRGVLDFAILKMVNQTPMHGYHIICAIRKLYHVYFGPSTIYPLLNVMEESGVIQSRWDLSNERPRKVYSITAEGINQIPLMECSLQFIVQTIQNHAVVR